MRSLAGVPLMFVTLQNVPVRYSLFPKQNTASVYRIDGAPIIKISRSTFFEAMKVAYQKPK